MRQPLLPLRATASQVEAVWAPLTAKQQTPRSSSSEVGPVGVTVAPLGVVMAVGGATHSPHHQAWDAETASIQNRGMPLTPLRSLKWWVGDSSKLSERQ